MATFLPEAGVLALPDLEGAAASGAEADDWIWAVFTARTPFCLRGLAVDAMP